MRIGGGATGGGRLCGSEETAVGEMAALPAGSGMAIRRREVFIEKVLKKLYPATPPLPQVPVPNLQSKTSPGDSKLQQTECDRTLTSTEFARLTDVEKEVSNQQKVYTVSLPPDDCVLVSPVNNTATESGNSESEEDDDGEESPGYLKRRRSRKKRKKSTMQCPNGVNIEETGQKKQMYRLQEELPLQTTDCQQISKNKKRKLKKKRRKEKLKAAGLLMKATCVDFMYQPEEAENEVTDLQDMEKKARDILDFLQATQEMYFTDSKFKSTDVRVGSVHEILQLLETQRMASSDVTSLHQLKLLIVLQDTERFASALENFKAHSTMPPEHRGVLCSLFQYWITDILPVKNRK